MQPAPAAARTARPDPAGPVAGSWREPATDDGDPVPEFPCAGSSRLLAALARPPAREVPGIRFTLRPDFDVTPETALAGGGGVVARGRPGPEPGSGRRAGRFAGVAEPARVRVRRDRRGQVADGPAPAGVRRPGRDPVAGDRAGQGGVPADGRPAARCRGRRDPAR